MKFVAIKVFRDDWFSIEQEIQSGKFYITIPVDNGMVEYSEYYEINEDELDNFLNNLDSVKKFVKDCRDHLNDDRLLIKPGKIRGKPL
ncbi:MAG: hypothetical protein HQK50_03570 [Oligoflexia bacterium]|nr:hypothetical protein [Oligoflexia bacterium]